MTVEFIYDLGSPNAYFCHKLLPGLAARTGTEITYVPCLLGGIFKETGNQPPMMAFAKIKGRMDYERLEITRFIKKHALTDFRFNAHFPINTLLLMRGAVAAQMEGQQEAYIAAAMPAMWEDSQKMDDPEVFVQVMQAAGLDGAHLAARAQEADVKEALVANTASAVARGAFGVPTFFVGDEIFFGKERLEQVEEEIKHQRAAG